MFFGGVGSIRSLRTMGNLWGSVGEVGEAVTAAEVEIGDDVASGVGAGVEEVDVGVRVVVAGHFAEVAVSAEDRGGVFEVEAKNEFRPGDCVEEAPAEKFA